MKITFYSMSSSPCCHVVWLTLKALNLEFTYVEIDLFAGQQKTAEFCAINPRGTVPALKDGDLCLGESRAIIQYLCNKYASGENEKLYPKNAEERALVDQVLYIDEDVIKAVSKYVNPVDVLFLNKLPGLGDEEEMKPRLMFFENFLKKKKFLAADHVTIADLSAIGGIALLDMCLYKYNDLPNLKNWVEEIRKLSYYYDACGKHSDWRTKKYQENINKSA